MRKFLDQADAIHRVILICYSNFYYAFYDAKKLNVYF